MTEATDEARALADDHGLEIEDIEGSGEDGRVLKADVASAAREADTDDILERPFRNFTKYVCGICERYHHLHNPEPVRKHIDQHH